MRCIAENSAFRHTAMPGSLPVGDHHPPEIVGDLLRIDAPEAWVAAGEFQPFHDVRAFHEAEMQDDSADAGAEGDKFDPSVGTDLRCVRVDAGQEYHAFMQDPVVLEVMGQTEWNTCCRRRENRRRAGKAERRRSEDPFNKLVLALAQTRALVFEQLPSRSPS